MIDIAEWISKRIYGKQEVIDFEEPDIEELELVQKLCDEDFYKEDYRETTLKLISDSLEYEMLKTHYKELVEQIENYEK